MRAGVLPGLQEIAGTVPLGTGPGSAHVNSQHPCGGATMEVHYW